MQMKNKKSVFALLALATVLAIALAAVPAATVSAAGSHTVQWKDSFGGSNMDIFYGVTATSDGGYVAVGVSNNASFGNNDWTGITGNGGVDAIIVKYNASGNVVWKTAFGGNGTDIFQGVATTSDGGYVAVGTSEAGSFGNGDLSLNSGNGGIDAIIVKFDAGGNMLWAKNFGGAAEDDFYGVTRTTDNGFIAVGRSLAGSFGTGDWNLATGRGGSYDAIAVKYDSGGNVLWKTNFGGSGSDRFQGVAATTDGGCVAVGNSTTGSGDWAGFPGKGSTDATIVKFKADGTVDWQNNFGGSGGDQFEGVAATTDGGFVAVGYSYIGSFGTGDLLLNPGNGGTDAIIVKFDAGSSVVWAKNFGGVDNDQFNGVTATADGFVAVGLSNATSFGNGDWAGVAGKGGIDAIAVKYSVGGIVDWATNFGGNGGDRFQSVTATSGGGFVAAGWSEAAAFGNGDWDGVPAMGSSDATIVRYVPFTPVTNITGVPSSATAGTPLTLTGATSPSDATYKNIAWSVKNAGTTGATIAGSTLSAPDTGTVVVTATVANGSAVGTPYEKDFTITVTAATTTFVPVTDVNLVGTSSMAAGSSMALLGSVNPSDATYKNIAWSVKNAGTTGATIAGSTLSAPDTGTVVVTATVANGSAMGTPYVKDFTITVTDDGTVDPGDDSDGGGGTSIWVWVAVGVIIGFCAVFTLVFLRRKGTI